jgi:hypothetical protein
LEEVDPNDFSTGTKNLSLAIKQLPELTKKKNLLDMHMNIATSLFKSIQTRQLDALFRMEESVHKLVTSINNQTKPNIHEMIKDAAKFPQDKMRLFLIYYLSREEISDEEVAEYTTALKLAGCETSSLDYAKT